MKIWMQQHKDTQSNQTTRQKTQIKLRRERSAGGERRRTNSGVEKTSGQELIGWRQAGGWWKGHTHTRDNGGGLRCNTLVQTTRTETVTSAHFKWSSWRARAALAVKGESIKDEKTIICCGSEHQANTEGRQNPLTVKHLDLANYTSVWSPGNKLKEKMFSPLAWFSE